MESDGEVIRCMETESEALLKFKEGLIDNHGMLSSWGRGMECCKWEGVWCSNTTGNVIRIELVGGSSDDNIRYYLGGEISSSLLKLHNLNVLDLSANDFGEIGNLNNLRTLDLSSNQFSGTLPTELGNLTNIRKLSLSFNQFSETLPAEIVNLTNLDAFHISNNIFSGIVPSRLWSLTNIEDLDLSGNKLTSSATDTLFNMSINHVAPSLRILNLQSNEMKRLPSCIWQFSMLEELVVSSNSLEGTITETHLDKLHNLKVLYLSFNSLALDINPDWIPRFQLSEIALSGCKVGPHFPSWLRTQSSFKTLDLSNNDIAGEVPKWLWSKSHEVNYLNLSHNKLSGAISNFSPINIEYIDLSRNKFSGPMPLLLSTSTIIFQISENMISGPLSFICSVHPYNLNVLDLSDNLLAGKLPNCWENMAKLVVLNLANNNFSGEIPHALGYLSSLRSLHSANNTFSGELPSNLKKWKQLRLIDIGDNILTGTIPSWTGEYDSMVYLILRNNRFDGSIPLQICYLSHIRVLDLSGNNLSGMIPPCFNNFSHFVMNIPSHDFHWISFKYSYYEATVIEYTKVLWKGTESEYGRNLAFLRLIDLSNNRLVGHMPSSFLSLKELHSLNLSRNRLTGIIDPDICQMRSLESLDMSFNQLSGVIPAEFSQLNFLSVLDLSNNSLSGKIPKGTQLQAFPASAYDKNIGLCGYPLPPCPGDSFNSSNNNEARNADEEYDGGILSLSFLKEFGTSIILGSIFGFWGVVGSLTVKASWRRKFYNLYDWLFVRAAIFWKNLRRR